MLGGVGKRVTSDAFVGRRGELRELESALDEVRGGRSQLVLLAGESGVGKSRLAGEFAARARVAGARVLTGDCVELGDGELPYGPIVSALRPLARAGDPVLDELGPARSELARLLPELGSPGDLRVEPLGGSGQGRLLELLLGLLERLGRDQPLVLVLEDVHWADRSSREFIAFLSRNLCAERCLLLLSYRSDELHRRHPLRPLLADLLNVEGVRRLELAPLSRDELGALLGDILGAPPGGTVLERLFARSEGNPLFVEELVAAGVDGRGDLPTSLREALMLRVEALEPDAQEVLRWLAIGSRLKHETLARTTGFDARTLRDALREAVGDHLVVSHADGTYGFRHALLREAVEDDLLPGERGQLHLGLAEALESDVVDELCVRLDAAAAVAHHFDRAGDQPRALVAAVRAGDAAAAIHAHGEAAALFDRALELWDRVPDGEDLLGVDHVDLLRRAAASHQDADHARAGDLLRRALAEVDREAAPRRAASLLQDLGRALWLKGKNDGAQACYAEALELLDDGRPTDQLARTLAMRAAALMLAARYAEARDGCLRALEVARAAGSRWAELHARNTLGVCLLYLGDPAEAERLLRDALDGAREAGFEDQIPRAYINLSDVLHLAGRTREALGLLRDGRAEVDGTWLRIQEAEMAYHLGLLDASEALLPADGAPRHVGQTRVFHQMRRAEVDLARGDLEGARRRLTGAREEMSWMLEPQWVVPIAAMLASLHRRHRDVAAAREAVAWGLERVGPAGDVPVLARLLAAAAGTEEVAARMARDLGRHGDELQAAAAAADHAARAVAGAGTPGGRNLPETGAYAAVAEAHAAAAAGHDDPELWAAAATRWDALERPYRAARSRWREAEALMVRGDRAAAAQRLVEAHRAARGMGAHWLVEQAEALARRARLDLGAAGTPPDAVQDPGPDAASELGLTVREREVLELVADGHTNREIGERLFMAESTASVHVSRILAKLDVRSRTEAAAVAHRLGLAGGATASAS
jgi:DNA-binding CsgD family transcriptional regulator/tetratricopeptide (TPR) repeat protein